jgi:small subunit ribosomal protein S1
MDKLTTDKIAEDKPYTTRDVDTTVEDDQDEIQKQKAEESDGTDEDVQGSDNFMELYEESLKSIQEGEVVKGEIVQINKEYVLVDIGYKSEGQIRIQEFIDPEGNLTAKVGEKVEVLLERRESDDGTITLSKEKAAKIKIWDHIKEVYESNGTIKGKIISRVKGGLSVDIGLQAFLPGSQVDLRPVRDMDALIETEHEFKIVKYNKRRGNIVLSRRAILESERSTLREKTLKMLEEDTVLEGTVKNITDYGLFIDLGGLDGLVHITDMSWGRVGHPSEMYQIGDKLTVRVLSFDRERERVSLGIKQLTSDPWSEAEEKYPINTRIKGRVVSLTDYGAFVEVEQGVEGLIHVSEMSWTRKIRHPSQILNVGDIVEGVVLNMNVAKKRISLGMKQVEPNPWDVIEEKYPIGTTIEGKIKNLTDFGIFIGIDEGIDGLVHISDISWTKRIKHPSELYKKGQEVRAVVLNIDKENERFSLGIKQMTSDPWDEIPRRYKPGTRVTGTVTNVTDFGLFLELEEGVEGLVHISEISKDKHGNPLARFQVDDVIQAKVLNVTRQEKKIALSIRKLEEGAEKDVYTSYLNNQQEATSNLGELLREEMMSLQQETPTQEMESEGIEASEETSESGHDTHGEISDSPSEEPPSGDSEPQDLESKGVEASEQEAFESDPGTSGEISDSPSEEPPSGDSEPQDLESKGVEASEQEASESDPGTSGEISDSPSEEIPSGDSEPQDLESKGVEASEQEAFESDPGTSDEISDSPSEEPPSENSSLA